jgi:hypothetical protein
MMETIQYWQDRYKKRKNSGHGSYGILAKYKADVLNAFIKENDIKELIDFGCGDGNNMRLFEIGSYTGIDICPELIGKLQLNYPEKIFALIPAKDKYELTISFDVIYHLIEDHIFNSHMQDLFNYSSKYVVIYSSDTEEEYNGKQSALHVRQRNFTKWIEQNAKDFKLLKYIKNPYPYNPLKYKTTSISNFYIYEKCK